MPFPNPNLFPAEGLLPGLLAAPDFAPALGDLQDHLPDWWRTRDPASNLYAILVAVGYLIDRPRA
jgi:hypothetical protein